MRLCDNCKREPESFQIDNGQTAWWFVIDSDESPEYLLSDLTFNFIVCTDIEGDGENKLWCVRCVESLNDDSEEDDP